MQVWRNGTMVYQSNVLNSTGDGVLAATPAPNVIGTEVRYVFLAGANTLSGESILNFTEFIIGGTKLCAATSTATVTVNAIPASPTSVGGNRCGTGSVTMTASGCTGGTISWYSSLTGGTALVTGTTYTTPSISTTTTYYLECSLNGCVSTTRSTAVATINAIPTASATGDVECVGSVITLGSSGGSSYSWSGPSGFVSTLQNPTISNAQTTNGGIYTVTVTSSAGCSATATANVVVNIIPAAPTSVGGNRCGTGSVTMTASGCTGGTISWYSSLTGGTALVTGTTYTTPSISTTTTYYLECSLNGCVSTTRSTAIATINAIPTASATGDTECVGSVITLGSSGGSSYSWSGPSGFVSTLQNPTISNAQTTNGGIYTVTVTSSAGCSATATANVVVNVIPAAPTSVGGNRCGTGSVTMTASGCTGGTISWYSSLTGGTALVTGTTYTTPSISTTTTYYLECSLNGCVSTTRSTAVATINAIPTASATGDVECVGSVITLGSSGGSSYSWSGPSGFVSTLQNPTISNAQTTNGGIYTVTVTSSAGCSATATANVVVNIIPAAPTSVGGNRCGTGTVTMTASGCSGGTISWYSSLTGGTALVTGTTYTTPSISTTTTYYLECSLNGCVSTTRSTAIATINAIPTASATGDVECVGSVITLGSSGGSSYSWSGPSGFVSTLQNPTISNAQTTNGGIYTVTVTSSAGCSATATANVVVNVIPAAPTSVGGNRCGTGSVTMTASGCTGGTISWYSSLTGGTALVTGTTYTTPSISTTTTYYLECSLNGCVSTTRSTAIATINAIPTASATGDVECVGSVITLGSSGGSSYSWSGPSGFVSTLQNPTISNAQTTNGGIYTVTVTSSAGCSATATANVVVNVIPAAPTSVGGNRCGTGSVTMTASGCTGGTISWYSSLTGGTALVTGTTYTTPSISTTTTYYLECSLNGCVSTTRSTAVATINAIPTASATGDVECVGSVITLGSSGGSSYSWSGPSGFVSTLQNPTISNAQTTNGGIYTVTVTSSAGCSATATANVVVNIIPAAPTSAGGNRCGTGSVTMTASGCTGGTISWYSSLTGGTALVTGTTYTTPSISTTTTYYLECSLNGCVSTTRSTAVATINAIPTASATGDVECVGSVITLGSSGGSSYSWSGPSGFVSTLQNPTISNAQTTNGGIYTVTVTSSAGCSATATANVVVNIIPAAPTSVGGNRCGPGTVTMTASGCSGGTISWYSSLTGGTALVTGTTYTTPSISTTTTYYLECSLNGCVSTTRSTAVATINAIPTASATGDVECVGSVITLGSSGGSSYSWSGPSGFVSTLQNPSISNAQTSHAGIYTVTVTSSAGCSATATANVVVNVIPAAPTSVGGNRCGTGSVTMTASGCTGGTISWYSSLTGGTALVTGTTYATPSISTTTTYYLECSLNGCISTTRSTAVATINAIPTASATGDVECVGSVITLGSSGGSSYSWSGPSGFVSTLQNPTISNAQTTNGGIYTVTVTSSAGCSATATANVVVNIIPAAPTSAGGNRCGTGSVTMTASGCTGGTISWYSSLTGGTALVTGTTYTTPSISTTTTYYLECSLNGCVSSTRSMAVATINAIPTASATGDVECVGSVITLGSSGGSSYSWSGPSGFVSTLQNPTISNAQTTNGGIYTVTVTSSAGCSATATANVVVNIIPAAPTSAGGNRCGTGSVTMTASGCSGGTISWYSSLTGGTALVTGTTYTTPSISTTTTYYLECSLNGCVSTTRSTAIATINAIPTASATGDVECVGSVITLGSSGGSSYSWSGPSGFVSTLQNPTISNAQTTNGGIYTVTVTSSAGCSATATANVVVNIIPAAPTSVGGNRCGTGTVTMTASGCTGGTISWYSSLTGGTALVTGTTYATPSISTTTTYYLECSLNGCVSTTRSTAVATINAIPTASATGDVECVGSVITLGSSGGSSYSWSGPSGFVSTLQNPTISNAQTTNGGIYTVTVTSSAGCSATATANVVVNIIPAAPTSVGGNRCGTGSVTMTASGCTGGTISWYSSLTGGTALVTGTTYTTPSISTTTTYYLECSLNGCVSTTRSTAVATINAIPTASATGDVECVGSVITLGSSGGSSYSWSGPSGFVSTLQNPSISNAQTSHAGIYTVTVTSSAGCSATATANVVVNVIPAAPTSVGGNRCGTGSVTMTASGCTGGTISWYSSLTGGTALVTGTTYTTPSISTTTTYYLECSLNGCVSTTRSTAVATINAIPTASATGDVECVGSVITLGSSGGSSYSWSGPSGFVSTLQNPTISNAQTTNGGIYTVTVTSSAGCSATATANVVVNIIPAAPTSAGGNRCGTGSVTMTASGCTGGTISWYSSLTGGTALVTGTTYTTPSISTTTTYYLECSLNGCVSTTRSTAVATINAIPTASATGDVECVGSVITLGSSGGSSYSWSGPSGFVSTLQNPTISNAQTTNGGIYTVTVTSSAGCSATATANVVVNIIPAAPTSVGGNRCGPGTVTMTASGCSGGTISWYSSLTGGTALVTGTTYTTPSISTTTTYYLECSLNGCVSTTRSTAVATINAIPTASATGDVECVGSVITLGSSGGSSYSWSGPSGFVSTLQNPTISNAQTTNGGIYTVTVTSSAGCSATATANVVVNIIPAAPTSVGGNRCGPGTVTMTASGCSGGTISWYSSLTGGTALVTGTTYTTPSISTTTTYYLECSLNGCVSTTRSTAVATINAIPTASATGDVECVGSVITLGSSGGSSYSWSGPSGFVSTLQNPTISNAQTTNGGIYTVTVTSSAGCSATATANVVVNIIPAAPTSAGGNRCGTGSVTMTASGCTGGTISWYSSLTGGTALVTGTTYTTPSISTTTTYYLECSLNGCVSSTRSMAVATINAIPTASATGDVECVGSVITLGSSGGSSYSWSGPSGFVSTLQNPTISNAQTTNGGIYTVTVTSSAGCSATATANVVVNIIPAAPTSAGGNRCGTGSVTMTASGCTGGTISWYSSLTGGTALVTGTTYATPSISTTTTYYLECSLNGCVSTTRSTAIATINAIPTASATGDVECVGSVITLGSSGGSSYSWSGPSGFVSTLQNPTISNAQTTNGGIYTVTVTSSAGCSATATANVVVNIIPAAPTSVGGNRCGTGSVTMTASGCTGGTISWYSSLTGGTALVTGTTYTTPSISTTTTYYLECSLNGCVSTTRSTAIATINAIPTASATGDVECVGSVITLGSSGGSSYSWSGPSGFVSTLQNPTISNAQTTNGGIYTVTVTSSAGCSATATANVVVNVIPAAPTSVGGNRCGTGSVTMTASGCTGGTISWYSSLTGGTALVTGTTYTTPSISTTTTYYLECSLNGCVSTTRSTAVATINAIPTASATGDVECVGSVITLGSSGGSSYSWSGPSGFVSTLQNPTISNAQTTNGGIYTVTVTSSAGCSATATANVVVNIIPAAPTSVGGNRCGPGTVTMTASGCTGGTISWYSSLTGGTALVTGTTYTTPSISTTTTYYLECSLNGCVSTTRSTAVATINAIPTASATGDVECVGSVITLGSSGGSSYSWSGPDGFVSTLKDVSTAPVTASMAGIYSVTVNVNGCTATATTNVSLLTTDPGDINCSLIPTLSFTSPTLITGTAGAVNAQYRFSNVTGGTDAIVTIMSKSHADIDIVNIDVPAATYGGYEAAMQPIIDYNWINGANSFDAAGEKSVTFKIDFVETGTTTPKVMPNFIASGIDIDGSGLEVREFIESSGHQSHEIQTPTSLTLSGGLKAKGAYATYAGINELALDAVISYGYVGKSSITITYGAEWNGNSSDFVDNTNPTMSDERRLNSLYFKCYDLNTTVCDLPLAAPTGVPANRCGTGTVTLSATGCSGTYKWYNATTGGTAIGTSNSFTTPSIAVNTTYYVECNAVGCTSTRISVLATVNTVPTAPSVSSNSICGSGSITLTATGCTGGTVSWFTSKIGGTSLGTGTTYTASALTSSAVYFAACTNSSGCVSATRNYGVATVNPIPDATLTGVGSLCLGYQPTNSGKLVLTKFKSTDTFSYNIGSSYNSGTASAFAAIPINGEMLTGIADPNTTVTYTVRIKNNENCTIDRNVTLTNQCSACPAGYCEPSTVVKTK